MKKYLLIISLFLSVKLIAQSYTMNRPHCLAIDSKSNLYTTMAYGIAKITPDGKITIISKLPVPPGSPFIDRTFQNLVIDSKDNLYANDGQIIYKITVSDDNNITIKIHVGQEGTYGQVNGTLKNASFSTIGFMTIDKNDNIYVSEDFDKRKKEIGTNYVTDGYFEKNTLTKDAKEFSLIRKITPEGAVSNLKNTEGKYIVINDIAGLTTDEQGNIFFTSGRFARYVGKLNPTTCVFSLIAGQPYKRKWCPVYVQGEIAKAEFVAPETVIVNRKGEVLFADGRLHRVIRIANGKVSTLAGNSIIDPCAQNIGGRAQEGYKEGKATSALFYFPKGMVYNSKGDLFIADEYNYCIRKITPDGIVSTFAR